MKLKISNLLGIREAELELISGKVLEAIGPNAAGKTSLAVCAQAVLARDANPLHLPAPEVKRVYIHDDSDPETAEAVLSDEDGIIARWRPSAQAIDAPEKSQTFCRPEAVGTVDFTARRSAAERMSLLQGVLLPPPAQVLEALRSLLMKSIPPEDVKGVAEMVARDGWKAAEAVYGDRARLAKRSWAKVAGRAWAPRISADWRPEGWQSVMDRLTVQEAEEAVVTAREEYNGLTRVEAIAEADLEKQEDARAALPEAERALLAAKADLEAAKGERADTRLHAKRLQAEYNNFRSARKPTPPTTLSCPECEAELSFNGSVLIHFNRKEHDSAMKEYQDSSKTAEDGRLAVEAQMTAYDPHIREASDGYDRADKNFRAAQAHVEEFKRLSAATGEVDTEERRQRLAAAEQAVEDRRRTLSMVTSQVEGARLHSTILHYGSIAQAIGPRGCRAALLEKGLMGLNKGCEQLTSAASWPTVFADLSGTIYYGPKKRVVQACSESEKWRIQTTVQMVLAAMTHSAVVVLDRSELLDAANRAGLEAMLTFVTGKKPIAVLLCGTDTRTNAVPWSKVPWPVARVQGGTLVQAEVKG